MKKDNAFHFGTEWYELWQKQGEQFYQTANEYLKKLFDQPTGLDPNQHQQQIKAWLTALKSQWQSMADSQALNTLQANTEKMWALTNEAIQLMLTEWEKRSREKAPIRNITELYELWLHCCQEVYQRAWQSPAFNAAYDELLRMLMKPWQPHSKKKTDKST